VASHDRTTTLGAELEWHIVSWGDSYVERKNEYCTLTKRNQQEYMTTITAVPRAVAGYTRVPIRFPKIENFEVAISTAEKELRRLLQLAHQRTQRRFALFAFSLAGMSAAMAYTVH